MARYLAGGVVLLAGFALTVGAISFKAAPVSNAVLQVRAELDRDLANILSAVPVERNPQLTMEPIVGRGGLVTSPDRRFYTYVLCPPLPSPDDPERCAHRVCFEENPRSPKIYEVRGEPELQETTRLISGLKWVNDFTLSYERWEGPHFGHRYVFDVRSKKQVAAYDLFG